MSDSSEFVLRIELGNDAMQSPEDIADALRVLSVRLFEDGIYENGKPFNLLFPTNGGASERVRDLNGNTVGVWVVRPGPKRDTEAILQELADLTDQDSNDHEIDRLRSIIEDELLDERLEVPS